MGESEIEIEIDVIKNTNNTREWPLFGNGKPKTKQNTATRREDEKKNTIEENEEEEGKKESSKLHSNTFTFCMWFAYVWMRGKNVSVVVVIVIWP